MTDKLKSCPFCGGDAMECSDDYSHYIMCMSCECTVGYNGDHPTVSVGEFTTREEAIAAWNCRNTGEKTMGGIFRRLAADNGVTLDDLRGVSRVRKIAWPRQQGMLECRRIGMTYGQIADYLFRDKSTIISGIREAKKRDK